MLGRVGVVVCMMARRDAALRLDEAVADGVADEVDRGFEAQLVEDVAAVRLHGAGADDERLGDLLVAQPAHQQEHHLALAVGKLVVAGWTGGQGGSVPGRAGHAIMFQVALQQLARHGGIEEGLVLGDRAYGADRVLAGGFFQEVARGTDRTKRRMLLDLQRQALTRAPDFRARHDSVDSRASCASKSAKSGIRATRLASGSTSI